MSNNLRLEAVLAQQGRKRRLDQQKKQNAPAVKRKREERERRSTDAMRAWTAHMDAERCDAGEPPLYEVILQHVDIADPKFARLRARLVVSVKLAIADCEYRPLCRLSDGERERRLTRAREILALLEDDGRAP
jgi:hypothetical protein